MTTEPSDPTSAVYQSDLLREIRDTEAQQARPLRELLLAESPEQAAAARERIAALDARIAQLRIRLQEID